MIHPNVCFLILLICCWVVTPSLMAEKTNVGVAVFVADNTYVCGCGSDGAMLYSITITPRSFQLQLQPHFYINYTFIYGIVG